jgi:hypothetical protein
MLRFLDGNDAEAWSAIGFTASRAVLGGEKISLPGQPVSRAPRAQAAARGGIPHGEKHSRFDGLPLCSEVNYEPKLIHFSGG